MFSLQSQPRAENFISRSRPWPWKYICLCRCWCCTRNWRGKGRVAQLQGPTRARFLSEVRCLAAGWGTYAMFPLVVMVVTACTWKHCILLLVKLIYLQSSWKTSLQIRSSSSFLFGNGSTKHTLQYLHWLHIFPDKCKNWYIIFYYYNNSNSCTLGFVSV